MENLDNREFLYRSWRIEIKKNYRQTYWNVLLCGWINFIFRIDIFALSHSITYSNWYYSLCTFFIAWRAFSKLNMIRSTHGAEMLHEWKTCENSTLKKRPTHVISIFRNHLEIFWKALKFYSELNDSTDELSRSLLTNDVATHSSPNGLKSSWNRISLINVEYQTQPSHATYLSYSDDKEAVGNHPSDSQYKDRYPGET